MSKSETPILSSSKIGRRSFLKMAALGSASFGAGNLLAKEENIRAATAEEVKTHSQEVKKLKPSVRFVQQVVVLLQKCKTVFG